MLSFLVTVSLSSWSMGETCSNCLGLPTMPRVPSLGVPSLGVLSPRYQGVNAATRQIGRYSISTPSRCPKVGMHMYVRIHCMHLEALCTTKQGLNSWEAPQAKLQLHHDRPAKLEHETQRDQNLRLCHEMSHKRDAKSPNSSLVEEPQHALSDSTLRPSFRGPGSGLP